MRFIADQSVSLSITHAEISVVFRTMEEVESVLTSLDLGIQEPLHRKIASNCGDMMRRNITSG